MKKLFILLLAIVTHSAMGQFKSKIDSLESLLPSANDTTKVILMNKLSFEYMIISSLDTAKYYGKNAFEYSESIHYTKGKAKALINMGNVFLVKSNYDSAKKYFLGALTLAKEIKNDQVISHSVNNLGEIARNQNNYPEALEYYLEGLRIDEKRGDKSEIAISLNNIGLTYKEFKNIPKAIDFLKRSLALNQEINSTYYMGINLINIASAYEGIDIDSARSYYEQALAIHEAIGDVRGILLAQLGIGNILLEKNELDAAFSYYSKALKRAQSIGAQSMALSCMNNMGIIYLKKGQLAKAIESYEQVLMLAKQLGAKIEIRNAYQNLAEGYRGVNDYKNAYHYHALYTEMNDSIFNETSVKQIAEMEGRYKSEKSVLELAALQKEQALQRQINRNQTILFAGALALAIAIGFIFYFRAQLSKQKNVLLVERVDAQNRELSSVALLVDKKNQAFTDIKSKLSAGKSNPEQLTGSLHTMIKDIDQEIKFDAEWNTFKYHFEKVHPDFFTKLNTAVPTLTDKEVRFCAYVKNHLSTKEIARLSGLTPRSVQQTRYRINLKFAGLPGSSLSDNLKKLA